MNTSVVTTTEMGGSIIRVRLHRCNDIMTSANSDDICSQGHFSQFKISLICEIFNSAAASAVMEHSNCIFKFCRFVVVCKCGWIRLFVTDRPLSTDSYCWPNLFPASYGVECHVVIIGLQVFSCWPSWGYLWQTMAEWIYEWNVS